jgi:hypothetical protein
MSNYKVGSGETEVFVTEVTPIVAETPQQQGSWKSGLFSCCKYGCFHPALLCGWCFPTILMGQVRTYIIFPPRNGLVDNSLYFLIASTHI